MRQAISAKKPRVELDGAAMRNAFIIICRVHKAMDAAECPRSMIQAFDYEARRDEILSLSSPETPLALLCRVQDAACKYCDVR